MSLEDRSFVVLGASGGIGSELARRLGRAGARALLCARGADRLGQLAQQTGGTPFPMDATRPDEVQAALARAIDLHGGLDGLVNLVGTVFIKPAHLTKDDEWASTLADNLGSAFFAVRAAARAMKSGGSVVLLSSVAARVGLANHEAIAAAKAGILGLTLAAAATYAPRGLRFNCVAPGLVETPATARIVASDAGRKASMALHPLGRLGQPRDVASAILWLLDPENDWVTGQVLGVDGGLSSVRAR